MLKLMYITNQPAVARIAESAGVDRVFVDLETRGKHKRQGHRDTVISEHTIADVAAVRAAASRAELLVRINPIYDGSRDEIEEVLAGGADAVMLPYFHTPKEVQSFLECVDSRATTCLLFETPAAAENVDEILTVGAIDEAYVGLNDLHLGYGMTFMFELLADGTVERLCEAFRRAGLRYGFGGIASLGKGLLPAEHVIAEHYRLGSEMVILSRSFCAHGSAVDEDTERTFAGGVAAIRELERIVQGWDAMRMTDNRLEVEKIVAQVVRAAKECAAEQDAHLTEQSQKAVPGVN